MPCGVVSAGQSFARAEAEMLGEGVKAIQGRLVDTGANAQRTRPAGVTGIAAARDAAIEGEAVQLKHGRPRA